MIKSISSKVKLVCYVGWSNWVELIFLCQCCIVNIILDRAKKGTLGSSILYFWLFEEPYPLHHGFDDTYVNWNDSDFTEYDWTDFHGDVREEIPSNSLQPLGKPVQMNVFVGANHARNLSVTNRHFTMFEESTYLMVF
jgi:hypothetical protein